MTPSLRAIAHLLPEYADIPRKAKCNEQKTPSTADTTVKRLGIDGGVTGKENSYDAEVKNIPLIIITIIAETINRIPADFPPIASSYFAIVLGFENAVIIAKSAARIIIP